MVQLGFLFLPPLLFILLPLEVLNSVLEVLLSNLLRLLLPVLPLQLPLLLLLQLEGLRLSSVLDLKVLSENSSSDDVDESHPHPHLPVLSHSYQPPDVRLDLDDSPELLLIDPDKARNNDKVVFIQLSGRRHSDLPSDEVTPTPGLQPDDVTPEMMELVTEDP